MIKLLEYVLNFKILFWIFTIPFKFLDTIRIKNKDEIFFYGYHGRYIGNAKALFEYYLEKDIGLKPIWLLDLRDNKKLAHINNIYHLPTRISNVKDHIRFILTLQRAKVLVFTSIGDLDAYTQFLNNKKHKKVLLPHGVSLKSTGIMAKHLSQNQKSIWKNMPQRFDLISATSKVEQYWLSAGLLFDPNKIKVIGPQRRDAKIKSSELSKYESKINMLNKSNILVNFTNETKFILYAPSHRDHRNLSYNFSLFENINNFNLSELDQHLVDSNVILFLREHMVASTSFNLNNNPSKLENIFFLTQQVLPEVESHMSAFDSIITDYSGIYLEWLESDVSLAFLPFDLEDYQLKRGLSLPSNLIFPGYIISTQNEFYDYIDNMESFDSQFIDKRKFLNSLLFEVPRGHSCELTALEIDKLTHNG